MIEIHWRTSINVTYHYTHLDVESDEDEFLDAPILIEGIEVEYDYNHFNIPKCTQEIIN